MTSPGPGARGPRPGARGPAEPAQPIILSSESESEIVGEVRTVPHEAYDLTQSVDVETLVRDPSTANPSSAGGERPAERAAEESTLEPLAVALTAGRFGPSRQPQRRCRLPES